MATANITNRTAAARLGVHEVTFSKKRQGRLPFTAEEIHLLAELVDTPVTNLLPAEPQAKA